MAFISISYLYVHINSMESQFLSNIKLKFFFSSIYVSDRPGCAVHANLRVNKTDIYEDEKKK